MPPTYTWTRRHGVDVLLKDGRSVATVFQTDTGAWCAWLRRADRHRYLPTRDAALAAVTPVGAIVPAPALTAVA